MSREIEKMTKDELQKIVFDFLSEKEGYDDPVLQEGPVFRDHQCQVFFVRSHRGRLGLAIFDDEGDILDVRWELEEFARKRTQPVGAH